MFAISYHHPFGSFSPFSCFGKCHHQNERMSFIIMQTPTDQFDHAKMFPSPFQYIQHIFIVYSLYSFHVLYPFEDGSLPKKIPQFEHTDLHEY
jgi:hypothetical protein